MRRTFALVMLLAIAAPVLGRTDLRELRDLWVAARRTVGPFEAPAETRQLLARVIADIRGLDLANLYQSIPDSGRADHARLVVFEAHHRDDQRMVRHRAYRSDVPAAKLFEITPAGPPLHVAGPVPGDGWLLGGAMPLDAERFRVRAATALRVGKTDPARAAPLGKDFLRRLEARVRERGPGIERASEILAEDFPSASEFLGRYVELGGEVAWAENESRLRVKPRLRARAEPLAADYPLFARFIARITGVVRAKGRGIDDADAVIAEWASLGPDGIEGEIAVRDGRLLPLRGEGEGYDIERPLRVRFTSGASIDALGLKTTIEGVHGVADLDQPARRWATTVAGMPDRTAVEGALFGVLTPGALDLLVPGSIESILSDLLRSILEGREKRGVEILVRAPEDDPAGHLVTSDLASDVSSARLVRVALAVGARWLYPSDDETDELKRFAHDFADRLVADAGS